MAPIEVVTPQPGENPAAIATSALIHAMVETDRVAIVRFIKKKNCTDWYFFSAGVSRLL